MRETLDELIREEVDRIIALCDNDSGLLGLTFTDLFCAVVDAGAIFPPRKLEATDVLALLHDGVKQAEQDAAAVRTEPGTSEVEGN